MKIIFITSSKNKIQEAEKILGLKLEHQSLNLPEIQAVKCEDVVEAKARAAFEILKRPVMVEDTGLRILAWGQLPGALIRWFIDETKVDGICKMLSGFHSREAVAETVVGIFDGIKFQSFKGEMKGIISERPRGGQGFGWDKIFIPEGAAQTFAEMDLDTKLKFSMRTKAFEAARASII